MSTTSLLLWLVGVALLVVGVLRVRAPWARYQGLRDQEANVARYEAWRGGLRTQEDGPTGASVAKSIALREAQVAGAIAIAGVVLILLGFVVG